MDFEHLNRRKEESTYKPERLWLGLNCTTLLVQHIVDFSLAEQARRYFWRKQQCCKVCPQPMFATGDLSPVPTKVVKIASTCLRTRFLSFSCMSWVSHSCNDRDIHISQEIFAIDMLTALKPSLEHDHKHGLRLLRLYGDQAYDKNLKENCCFLVDFENLNHRKEESAYKPKRLWLGLNCTTLLVQHIVDFSLAEQARRYFWRNQQCCTNSVVKFAHSPCLRPEI